MGGGGAALPPPHSSSEGPDPPASRLLPRSLSLPRTFPGQLGLKFSGEAAPSPWDKGAARLRPGPLPDLPLGCPGWLQGASLRGEAAAAVAPPSPGRAASGDRLGIRVQLQPGGGEGPPLTQHAATLPWPREARACPAGLRARPVPGTPRPLRPGGAGRAPGSWRGGGRAEPGERGVLVRSCLAPQKLASTSQALAERGTQTFRTSSISPGFEAAFPPAPLSPEWGSRSPHFVLWARAPANLRLSPRLSLALPPCASGSPRSWFPKSCARGTL